MALLTVGDQAPDFTVQTTTGDTVSLAAQRGSKNVVLFFYPEDDTPGCTIEACAFRDDLAKYVAHDTVIWGVSIDDVASHQRFTQKFQLNFPLLADVDRAICTKYGVEIHGRHAKRVTYLIGKDGKIVHAYEKVAVQVHSRELLEALAALG